MARLRDNPGEEVVTVMDGEEEDMREEEKEEWEKWLPLEGREKVADEDEECDRLIERKSTEVGLYRCSDDSGTFQVPNIRSGAGGLEYYCLFFPG